MNDKSLNAIAKVQAELVSLAFDMLVSAESLRQLCEHGDRADALGLLDGNELLLQAYLAYVELVHSRIRALREDVSTALRYTMKSDAGKRLFEMFSHHKFGQPDEDN